MSKRILYVLFLLASVVALAFSIVQFVSAVKFFELGRVLFYIVLLILSVELLVVCAIRLFKKNDRG